VTASAANSRCTLREYAGQVFQQLC
jgi:hypothetical protein